MSIMTTTATPSTQKTEELIIKLCEKEERKGINVIAVLFKVMKHFKNKDVDEKHNENKVNKNNKQISLLYDPEDEYVAQMLLIMLTFFTKEHIVNE